MVLPLIFPGIEQRNQVARRGQRRYVRTFVSIADHACIGEIVRHLGPAMLPADDVIDLVRKNAVIFVKQAIFTSELRAPNDLGAQFRGDLQDRPARISCALAFAKPRICSSRT